MWQPLQPRLNHLEVTHLHHFPCIEDQRQRAAQHGCDRALSGSLHLSGQFHAVGLGDGGTWYRIFCPQDSEVAL